VGLFYHSEKGAATKQKTGRLDYAVRPAGLGAFATRRPASGKAHGPAGFRKNLFGAKPRRAGLSQAALNKFLRNPTAGLKQPSLRSVTSQTLGQRNAALVQRTKARPGPKTVSPFREGGSVLPHRKKGRKKAKIGGSDCSEPLVGPGAFATT
jgi:hypothetical protein